MSRAGIFSPSTLFAHAIAGPGLAPGGSPSVITSAQSTRIPKHVSATVTTTRPTTSINQINSASSVSAPTQPMAMDKSKGKSMPSGDLNNRLDRLESLILTQHDDNNNFKTMVMNTLSIEPNADGIDENQSYDYDQDYMDYEDDVSDLSVPLGQEDPLLRQKIITFRHQISPRVCRLTRHCIVPLIFQNHR